MSGLVLELQQELLKETSKLSNSLLKAQVIAKKLNVLESADWINSELNGYPSEKVPNYRLLTVVPKSLDPRHQVWVPMMICNSDVENLFKNIPCTSSIAILEKTISPDNKADLSVEIPRQVLNGLVTNGTPFRAVMVYDKAQLEEIIVKVRNILLTWTLDLEAKGITGEKMSFNNKEKEIASKERANISISAYNVNIQNETQNSTQNISTSQVETIINIHDVKSLLDYLGSNKEKLNLTKEQELKLNETMAVIAKESNSASPKTSLIRQSLMSLKSILEGAAGSLLASGAIHMISELLK